MSQRRKWIQGPVISRRSFVERLGLTAGAAVLAPIAQTLVSEAEGRADVGTRKRAGFFVMGDCLIPHLVAPPEYSNLKVPVMDAPTKYTLPPALAPLEPIRNRIMVLDGLANQMDGQHSSGYGTLNCIKGSETQAPPVAITIDQFIANGLGQGTRFKSVLVSQGRYNPTRNVFASGPNAAEAGYIDPTTMYNQVFGGLMAPAGAGGASKDTIKNQQLLSMMRADVARLQKSLAGSEKAKLDIYLGLINDYDTRLRAQAPVDCKAPAAPDPMVKPDKVPQERVLDALWDLATLSLACGLTNVVGASVGCGQAHIFCTWPMIGHATDAAAAIQSASTTIAGMFSRIMRTVNALQMVKEGDRTAFDNTAIMYTSDNGGGEDVNHHTDKKRWPLVVVGNAGGKLKADGRFMRFPLKSQKQPGVRALADFYSTLAHAVGVPTDTFGMGGAEPIQGPIAELLA